jgi:hypothetical protein
VWREEGVYSRIKEVLDGMAQEPSRADGTGIYPWQSSARTLRIVLGHRCVGEFEARRAADELGDRIDRKTLEDWWLQPESMLASIYAFTGKGEADVRKALDLLTPDKRAAAPNLQEAKTLFQKAFASDDNERSREFCRVRLTEVDGLLAFGAGKPYERKFDPELIGWLAERGVWKRESDDAVVGHARGVPSPVLLVPVLSPVLPLDVEFDIEAIRPTNANLTLGLLMPQQGSPVAGMQGPARFALIPRQKLAVSEVAGKFRAFPCALKDVNRLRVRIADGRAMLFVNDELCLDRREREFRPLPGLILGCPNLLPPETVIRVQHVRFRKWEPPKEDPAETQPGNGKRELLPLPKVPKALPLAKPPAGQDDPFSVPEK